MSKTVVVAGGATRALVVFGEGGGDEEDSEGGVGVGGGLFGQGEGAGDVRGPVAVLDVGMIVRSFILIFGETTFGLMEDVMLLWWWWFQFHCELSIDDP